MATSKAVAAALPALTLVLGGARSGKSRYAEAIAGAAGDAIYVATAEAHDAEMAERIERHRRRRGAAWQTVEEPLDLLPALRRLAEPDRPVLVDCLTLWLSNLFVAGREVEREAMALTEGVTRLAGPVVFVANEVGLGIVPESPLGRAFRDQAGLLNQRLASIADQVVFVAAGLPLVLKGVKAIEEVSR